MSVDDQSPAAARIDIDGDVLISDSEFCSTVLAGANRRTARRYESDGLPYILIRGRKFRPLNAGRKWLASRVQTHKAPPQRRRRAR